MFVALVIDMIPLVPVIGVKTAKSIMFRQRRTTGIMVNAIKNYKIIFGQINSFITGQSAHKLAVNVNG